MIGLGVQFKGVINLVWKFKVKVFGDGKKLMFKSEMIFDIDFDSFNGFVDCNVV